MGSSSTAASPTQSPKVWRERSTPCRAKMSTWRFSGKWSAYLAVTTWASSPGPGRPLSIGYAGITLVTTCSSHALHAYVNRTCSVTNSAAG